MEKLTFVLMEDLPVLISTVHPGYHVAEDWLPGEIETRRLLDSQEKRLFNILDMRELKITMDDVIAAANMGTRGQKPLWQHPKIRGMYFVSRLKMVELAARGLNTPVFGNVPSKVFSTVEEALEDIKRVLASE